MLVFSSPNSELFRLSVEAVHEALCSLFQADNARELPRHRGQGAGSPLCQQCHGFTYQGMGMGFYMLLPPIKMVTFGDGSWLIVRSATDLGKH